MVLTRVLAAAKVSLLPVKQEPFAAPKVDKATEIAMKSPNPLEYFDAKLKKVKILKLIKDFDSKFSTLN